MKRFFTLLFLAVSMCPVFAKKVPEPEWFKNYKKVYPNSEYIAQRGSGATAEDAKTDAASQLARYFQSTVSANLSTVMSSITSGTSIDEETRVIDEVNVTSEVEFIGLEFTESWFYKPEKKWYAVAYINRNDAWVQYKPKIDAEKNKFLGFYNKAEKEDDSFTKISFYKQAWKVSSEFLEKLEYARILNPKEEEKYSLDRENVSELPSKIESESKKLTLEVLVTGDYGNIIENAVRDALKRAGFVIGKNGNYVAAVDVDSHAEGDEPIAILPSLKVTVKNRNDHSIYSYEANLTEKTVSYKLEYAQKKAFLKLAEKINEEFKF